MSGTPSRTATPASDVRLLQAEVELLRMSDADESGVLQRLVELAADLTESPVAHAHYVDRDQPDVRLAAGMQVPRAVAGLGVLQDAVRLRTPQRRELVLPDDHATLNYLSVPVLQAEVVVLLLGVGRVRERYSQADLLTMQVLADVAWLAVSRIRSTSALRARLNLLTDQQAMMGLTTWEWDPAGDVVLWDGVAEEVIPGFPSEERSWVPLLDILDEPSATALSAALRAKDRFSVELTGVKYDGSALKALLQADWSIGSQDGRAVLRGTLTDISLVSALEQAHRQATHDVLTGLPNRAWLIDALSERVLRPRLRRSDSFALYFIDLDDFKSVNDEHGHIVGDEVLVTCAQRIERQTRDRENVARYGGDEFVLIQDGPLTWESVEALAHRIRAAVAEPLRIGDTFTQVGASIGVAVCSGEGVGVADLLRNADEALFEAKRSAWGVVIRDV